VCSLQWFPCANPITVDRPLARLTKRMILGRYQSL
jgi:hypothetical protein